MRTAPAHRVATTLGVAVVLLAMSPGGAQAAVDAGPFAPIVTMLGSGGGVISNGIVLVRLLGGAAILVGAIKAVFGKFDTPAFVTIACGFIVLALGPEFILWFGVSPPTPKISPSPPGSGTPYLCLLCKTFTDFESTAQSFRETSYTILAKPALSLAQAVMLAWILAFTGGLFLKPKEGAEAVTRLLVQFAWFALVTGLLGAPDWVFANVVGLMEKTAVGVAGFIFDTMRATFAVAGGKNAWNTISTNQTLGNGVYAYLWGHVEATLYTIVNMLVWQFEKSLQSAGFFAIHDLVMALIVMLILGLPLTFVLGIFAAYLFQTMFYYMAISAVAPALIAGMLFRWSRGYVWAALKFLLGGALTLVFAAVAMSFTGAVIYLGLQGMWDQTGSNGATLVSDALIQAANATNGQTDVANPLAATNFATSVFSPLSSSFWITALMCWVSVLLHLAAPKIASNISGSNDSATSAAMVVAAGQMAVGMAGKMAFGNSHMGGGSIGAAARFINAARGNFDASNAANMTSHGVVGMAAERIGRMLAGKGGEGSGSGSPVASALRGFYHNNAGLGGGDASGGAYSAGGGEGGTGSGPSAEQTTHMRGFDRP